MLKRLFYASASILMLALAYHFGASDAHGQVSNSVVGYILAGSSSQYVLTANGDVYHRDTNAGGGWAYATNVAATAGRPGDQFTVFSLDGGFWAFAANGDVFRNTSGLDAAGQWTYINNVFGSPTPAAQPTWGQLKAQYRR